MGSTSRIYSCATGYSKMQYEMIEKKLKRCGQNDTLEEENCNIKLSLIKKRLLFMTTSFISQMYKVAIRNAKNVQ